MLPQIADFKAEGDDLFALLDALAESDWGRVTAFKGWTINDVVQHLHWGDQLAAASVTSPEAFAHLLADVRAKRASGLSPIEETRLRLGDLKGRRLLERWRTQLDALCTLLAAKDPDARLKWAGPDMGLRMFTTARQMETWAHGQEVWDVLGRERAPTGRLRNIAEIGVRTYGWTFVNRGLTPPGDPPHVRLDAPSGAAGAGAVWEWHPASTAGSVTGSALEFCQVVAQVRNIADTALAVHGEPARRWMAIAQCFAGPPNDPPAPGTRRRAG